MIRHLPNALTFARMLAVPLLVYLLVLEQKSIPGTYAFISALVFVIASLTDTFDGILARKLNVVTRIGKLFDPLADKIVVLAVLVMLTGLDRIEAWVVVVILAREFAVNMLRMFAVEEGVILPAGQGGKIKTTLQMVGISLVLLYESYFGLPILAIGQYLIYASAVLAWWTGVEYFVAYVRGVGKNDEKV